MLFAKRSLRDIGNAWVGRVRLLGPVLSALTTSPIAAQRVIEAFREAGAIAVQAAQPFHARSRLEQTAFAYLLSIEVIREPKRGRYYLDEGVLETRRRQFLLPWW
jgi:hypothetical protein